MRGCVCAHAHNKKIIMSIFKQKPYKTVEVGGFVFNFYFKEKNVKKTYLDILTVSDIWSMRIAGGTYTYGYLLAAVEQGMTEQLHGFAAVQYITAMQTTQDQGLVNDITKAIKKWERRMKVKAEEAAKNFTDTDEQVSQAVMESLTQEHDSKQFKEDVKEALDELNKK